MDDIESRHKIYGSRDFGGWDSNVRGILDVGRTHCNEKRNVTLVCCSDAD